MGKSGYHHKNLKEEMIVNSIRIMGAEGYDSFSMRKVAKACGVSHTAPYRHFKNKDNLVTAVVDEVNNKFDMFLKDAMSKHPDDMKNQLREMAFAYIKFLVENPEYMRFLFFSDFKKKFTEEKTEKLAFYDMSPPYQTFIQAVRNYRSSLNTQSESSANEDEMILAIWGLAHGIAVLITQNYFHYDGDCLALTKQIIWDVDFIR
ncbi:MAG: TetR/AcrR family transcriptional regulator [Eubacteriales bacterium]